MEKTLKNNLILYNAQHTVRHKCSYTGDEKWKRLKRRDIKCYFAYNDFDGSMFCLNCSESFSASEINKLGGNLDDWLTDAFSRDDNTIERDMNAEGRTKKEAFKMSHSNEQTGPPHVSAVPDKLAISYGGSVRVNGEMEYIDNLFSLVNPAMFKRIVTTKKVPYEQRYRYAKAFLKRKFESYMRYLNDLKIGKEKIELMFTKDSK